MINDGYWCTVIALPPDLSQEIYLGGFRATTPRLAVRWLRGQAARLANALDPQPGEGWAQGHAVAALRRLPDQLPDDWPDPGHRLRNWQHDQQAHETTMATLYGGQSFSLTVSDYSAYFMLSARPLLVTTFSPDHRLHEHHHSAAA